MIRNKLISPQYFGRIILTATSMLMCTGCSSVKTSMPESGVTNHYQIPEIHQRTHEQLLLNQKKLLHLNQQPE